MSVFTSTCFHHSCSIRLYTTHHHASSSQSQDPGASRGITPSKIRRSEHHANIPSKLGDAVMCPMFTFGSRRCRKPLFATSTGTGLTPAPRTRSPARSGRPVGLLCAVAVILVVSSRPLRNTQREFGGRFMCINWTLDNGPCVTLVAKKKRATTRMVMAMAMCGFMRG
jgi:hypothetical protein